MTRCAVCERERCEWAIDEDLHVAFRNGIYFPSCQACWMRWPDARKTWPREGFGRSGERVDGLVAVLQETAP